MHTGTCKLTGKTGVFVKSHIIPKAFATKHDGTSPITQAGIGVQPIRRWDSWYDATIVIREGEDILETYDAYAVEELRKHKLVWSSWGPMISLWTDDLIQIDETHGIRKITGIETLQLRLFLLSLLWRAAACNLREFNEISLSPEDFHRLTRMVRDNNPYPLDFYPIVLIQLSTIGPSHNNTPVPAQLSREPSESQHNELMPIYRFYFDGLCAHFFRDWDSNPDTYKSGGLFVGSDANQLAVTTVSFDASRQRESLTAVISSAYHDHPQIMNKIYRDK